MSTSRTIERVLWSCGVSGRTDISHYNSKNPSPKPLKFSNIILLFPYFIFWYVLLSVSALELLVLVQTPKP